MITNTEMCWGDQMGAQLNHLAELYYICRENHQQLVLFRELENFRSGFRFSDAFNIRFVNYLERAKRIKRSVISTYGIMTRQTNWEKRMKRSGNKGFYLFCDRVVYKWIRMDYKDFVLVNKQKDGIHTDPRLLSLNNNLNYNVTNGFGTYQDWKKYEKEIIESIEFKSSVVSEGDNRFAQLNSVKRKVSVHVRRTDYLVVFPYNLDEFYYKQAMNFFNPRDVQFLVFSDDIKACKEMEVFKDKDVVFIEGNSGPVDMYLMTKCDDNIIANSTFSFWGAFLNKNANKRVICPRSFVGNNAPEFSHINGNYYPDEWIAI